MTSGVPRVGSSRTRYAGWQSPFERGLNARTEHATTGRIGTPAVPCCPRCKGHTVRTSVTNRWCGKCEQDWVISFAPNSAQWTVSAI